MWNPFKRNKKKPEAPKVRVVPNVTKKDHSAGGPMDYDEIVNPEHKWDKTHRRRNDMRKATKKGAKHKRMKLRLVHNDAKIEVTVIR